MRATGVGDGTCNQINPLIFQDNYKCGLGSAGGNPCKKVIESFNSENSNHKVSDYITSIVLVFIIILIIYIYCNCSKSKNNKF